jgi:ribose transport system substrate-binding protein
MIAFANGRTKHLIRAMVLAGTFALAAPAFAQTQLKGLDEPGRDEYLKSLNGKVVAYLPIALSFDLTRGWLEGIKKELEPLGVKVDVRDPNWDTNAGAQALTTLIESKPAIIIAHNPDVQTYAKLFKKAEAEGIKVIQVNMSSYYQTAGYVGADWVEVGEKTAAAAVNACKGKSNKIAIVQGPTASAPSAYTLKGIEHILKNNSQIEVVSAQAADWDAGKAKGITQTVLRQNPDLCAIIDFWDGQGVGVVAAVKEAGLTGKVYVITSGGGEQKGACDQVLAGGYDMYLSYDVPSQAKAMAELARWLIQTGNKVPPEAKGFSYSRLTQITKESAAIPGTCWTLGQMH